MRPWLPILLLQFLFLIGCTQRSPEHLEELIRKLSSPDGKERNSAALEIGPYGEAGRRAVVPLIRLLQTDKNRGIRTSAAYALREIGTREAIEALDTYKE